MFENPQVRILVLNLLFSLVHQVMKRFSDFILRLKFPKWMQVIYFGVIQAFLKVLNLVEAEISSDSCVKELDFKPFSDMTSRLSHMYNTVGDFLHRRVHNSNKSSALFRREVEQPGAADRGRNWHINSAAWITWFCLQQPRHCSYHHKLSWHFCRCLLRVSVVFFTGRYLFSFCFFFFAPVTC